MGGEWWGGMEDGSIEMKRWRVERKRGGLDNGENRRGDRGG